MAPELTKEERDTLARMARGDYPGPTFVEIRVLACILAKVIAALEREDDYRAEQAEGK